MKPDTFQEIKLFSIRNLKISLNTSLSSISSQVEAMRLLGNFSNIVYHLPYELRARLHETRSELKAVWDFTSGWNFTSVLVNFLINVHMASGQVKLTSVQISISIVSTFCIIFSISLLEVFGVFKRFSIVWWSLRCSFLLLLTKEHCFGKNEFKSSAIFLKSVTY